MARQAELLADLARAFPRQRPDQQTLLVYLRELADIPADVLEFAVRKVIRSSEFFPTVRVIREAAAEHALGLPSESQALTQIEARMAWARKDEDARDPTPPPVHPLVKQALEHVGGFYTYRTADQPGVVLGQFLRLFKEIRAAEIQEAQVGRLSLDSGEERRTLGAGDP